jgi:hypothetical protein
MNEECPIRVTAVTPLPPHTVELTFSNGLRGMVNLSRWIVGQRGALAALQNEEIFRQVMVDPDAGALVWPGGISLRAEALYAEATDRQPGMVADASGAQS